MRQRQRIVEIDCRLIRDFSTFHDVFAAAFGFPDFYGRNMDAWIDCMSNLDDGFCRLVLEPGDMAILRLQSADELRQRVPDVFAALIEAAAFVNERRIETEEPAILALSYR